MAFSQTATVCLPVSQLIHALSYGKLISSTSAKITSCRKKDLPVRYVQIEELATRTKLVFVSGCERVYFCFQLFLNIHVCVFWIPYSEYS